MMYINTELQQYAQMNKYNCTENIADGKHLFKCIVFHEIIKFAHLFIYINKQQKLNKPLQQIQ